MDYCNGSIYYKKLIKCGGIMEKQVVVENKSTKELVLKIAKIVGKINRQGYTLVPLKLYFKDALIKMEVALCKGKHTYDKKQSIAARDVQRSIDRDVKNAGF